MEIVERAYFEAIDFGPIESEILNTYLIVNLILYFFWPRGFLKNFKKFFFAK